MTHHTVILDAASESRARYGILYVGRHVYDTTESSAPTRLNVWSNENRPNPYHGAKLGDRVGRGEMERTVTRWFLNSGQCDPLYLDPHNEPTDDPISLLLTTESSAICSNTSMNTGQPGSGQVYARGAKLADGDTATVIYPGGQAQDIVLHFPPNNNGHGYATFA